MDFDVVDDTRPRFQLQSGPLDSQPEDVDLNKFQIAVCVGFGILLLSYAWTAAGLYQFLALWLASSLLIGPFAPSFVTGGDCRVGFGRLLPEVVLECSPVDTEKRSYSKTFTRKHDTNIERVSSRENMMQRMVEDVVPVANDSAKGSRKDEKEQQSGDGSLFGRNFTDGTEKEWTGDEIDLLRKQMVKHPRGTLQRWEVISEAFAGAHSVESVIKMSKLLGEKKFAEGDAYAKFLAERKGAEKAINSPLSQRWDANPREQASSNLEPSSSGQVKGGKGKDTSSDSAPNGIEGKVSRSDWTEKEDKALLTALKVFPKDTPMRWDKVAVAVPGKSNLGVSDGTQS